MSVRSLGAAASGIDTMQTDLDTIGNDIANSETDGFKSGTAQFEDLLTEQLQPAGAASGSSLASTNPSAVGAGAEVSAIATDFSEGPVTQTGVSSDVAIEGNGFLVVSQNGQTSYTRDGDLQIDADGNLATPGGGLVLGWTAGQPTTSPPGPLSVIVGSAEPPAETQNVDLGGNLPAGATTPVTVTTTMYDALGNAVPVALTFTPTGAANTWSMQGTVPGAAAPLWTAPQTVTFGANGQLASINGAAVGTGTTSLAINTVPSNYTWNGAAPQIDFPPPGSENAVTQFASVLRGGEFTRPISLVALRVDDHDQAHQPNPGGANRERLAETFGRDVMAVIAVPSCRIEKQEIDGLQGPRGLFGERARHIADFALGRGDRAPIGAPCIESG